MGHKPRVNDSIGPMALAASLRTLRRIKRAGRELTLAQRNALRESLLALVAEEEPEPSFNGVDAVTHDLIESHYAEDSNLFARAAWGKDWRSAFPPEAERQKRPNAFDPNAAEALDLQRYERFLDGLWSAAQKILADSGLGEARSCEWPSARSANAPRRETATRRIRAGEGLREQD